MASNNPVVSTGRGGSGNIGHDTRQYADGEIVREGIVGQSDKAEYSSGRGGAGNIVSSPRLGAQTGGSHDVVPDAAVLDNERRGSQSYHTGRGGEGNIHKEKQTQQQEKPKGESLIDKAKEFLHVHSGQPK